MRHQVSVPGRGEGTLKWPALGLVILSVVVFVASASAGRRPYPGWWLQQALCIHRHESVDWHRRWVDWRGRPSRYAGGMQFLQSTWASAGGRGEPWQATPAEQLYRAWIVWDRDSGTAHDGRGSWREWGTASLCGLR